VRDLSNGRRRDFLQHEQGEKGVNGKMELPFAVESPVDGAENNIRRSNSLQHSESDSLVIASSQGSFMNLDDNNLSIADTCGPLIPNTPQDILLPSRHHQQQGQLVVIPAESEEQNVSTPDGGYGDPENDFTYVNVTEIDADDDVLLDGEDVGITQHQVKGDILTVLIGGIQGNDNCSLLNETESANEKALKASDAKKKGDLLSALEYHTQAARLYKDIARFVRDRNPSLASSLLLLSQTQAKSAIALKGIVKLNPTELRQILPPSSRDSNDNHASAVISHKERLRAAVRGALSSSHPHEADLSDSQFLGSAKTDTTGTGVALKIIQSEIQHDSREMRKGNKRDIGRDDNEGTLLSGEVVGSNPVDVMMELERELRDIDMAPELGNSISSLDTRMQNRMKSSMIGDGSFMVVPPGSSSYMASSMWGSHNNSRQTVNNQQGTAGVRARANRVQNILEASATPVSRQMYQSPQLGHAQIVNNKNNTAGLESSWWGNTNTTSQILTSSVLSLGVRGIEGGHSNEIQGGHSTSNTEQIIRLMDSLKALGDENANLLREVEELQAARAEAKAARETMKRFKADYGKRFASLKKALEKFRHENPAGKTTVNSPVSTSEFMKNATVSDQLKRQEQMIQKLTRELKKEKEESKKKDSVLRKYESFYRDIKARSAQKAALRQTQQQRQNTKQTRASNPRPPR